VVSRATWSPSRREASPKKITERWSTAWIAVYGFLTAGDSGACPERNFSYAVARAYAGHSGKNDAGTTSTYVRADIYEVARAVAELTGEPHPLAPASVTRSPDEPFRKPFDQRITGG
jgi:hypothetical protein